MHISTQMESKKDKYSCEIQCMTLVTSQKQLCICWSKTLDLPILRSVFNTA